MEVIHCIRSMDRSCCKPRPQPQMLLSYFPPFAGDLSKPESSNRRRWAIRTGPNHESPQQGARINPMRQVPLAAQGPLALHSEIHVAYTGATQFALTPRVDVNASMPREVRRDVKLLGRVNAVINAASPQKGYSFKPVWKLGHARRLFQRANHFEISGFESGYHAAGGCLSRPLLSSRRLRALSYPKMLRSQSPGLSLPRPRPPNMQILSMTQMLHDTICTLLPLFLRFHCFRSCRISVIN